MGLGQVLGKLGMQQPHGERHHGAWTEGRDGRGIQGRIMIKKRKKKKTQGGMRTGEIGRKRGRQADRKTERAR